MYWANNYFYAITCFHKEERDLTLVREKKEFSPLPFSKTLVPSVRREINGFNRHLSLHL